MAETPRTTLTLNERIGMLLRDLDGVRSLPASDPRREAWTLRKARLMRDLESAQPGVTAEPARRRSRP